jgi:hypothetical protein
MRKHEGSTAAQLKYIRNEIEMRVIGLGWLQFETRWSSVQAESVGSVTSLKALLKDILVHEAEERRLKRLPTEAAPPPLKMRTLKELGESSTDAMEIAGKVNPPLPARTAEARTDIHPSTSLQARFDINMLRTKAEDARKRRVELLISNDVEDQQPFRAPSFGSLMNKTIEVLWPYYLPDGTRQLVWAPGRVVGVADGTTHKAPRERSKILPAGAVPWEWDADERFGEQAGKQWLVLNPERWNQSSRQYGWRYDARELAARAAVAGDDERPNARQRRA